MNYTVGADAGGFDPSTTKADQRLWFELGLAAKEIRVLATVGGPRLVGLRWWTGYLPMTCSANALWASETMRQ